METFTHSFISLSLIFLVSTLAVVVVYRVFPRRASARPASRLEVSPHDLGSFSYRQLILVSVLSLFVEMLMIRWVSSEIRIFAYFKNFVLVACFLGFGLGCYFSRRRVQLIAIVVPLLLLTIVLKTPISPLRRTMAALPQLIGGGVEVHVWGVPSMPASWTGMLLALMVVVPLFAVIATTFIPFGQLVGWYLENSPNGVKAYSANVLASLAGIAGFTLLCFLHQAPWVWFLFAGMFAVLIFWKHPAGKRALCATFLGCVCLLAIPDHRHATTYWSPYQKLVLQPVMSNGQIDAYNLMTNDTWYQKIVNLSPAFVQSRPEVFSRYPVDRNSYTMPYHFYPAPPSPLRARRGRWPRRTYGSRPAAGWTTSPARPSTARRPRP